MLTTAIGSESEPIIQTREGEDLFGLVVPVGTRLWMLPYMNMKFCDGTNNYVDIVFHSHTVRIEGEGLRPMVHLIAQHRLRVVQQGGRSSPLVTRIEVRSNDEGEDNENR